MAWQAQADLTPLAGEGGGAIASAVPVDGRAGSIVRMFASHGKYHRPTARINEIRQAKSTETNSFPSLCTGRSASR